MLDMTYLQPENLQSHIFKIITVITSVGGHPIWSCDAPSKMMKAQKQNKIHLVTAVRLSICEKKEMN